MTNTTLTRRVGYGAEPRVGRVALAALVLLWACDPDRLLEVDEPTFATPESLASEEGLPVLFAGAMGDFQIAYSGSGGDAFLSVASLITDELKTSDTFTTRQATDQREQQPMVQGNTSDAAYSRLQYARRSAAEVADMIAEFSQQGAADPRYATMRAIEGYAIVALADGFCGAVPIGTAKGGAPLELGTPFGTEQLYGEAVSRFDAALTSNPNSSLARVGKGRAHLARAEYAQAAAAVASVPTSFVHFVEHSTNSSRQHNPIYSLQQNGRYSMADREGGTGLPFRSSQDPRLPWIEDPRRGFDAAVPLYINLRYTGFGSNVPLADGIEARLIEAEAALNAGDVGTWLSRLNELRTDVRDLMSARYLLYETLVPGPNNPSETLEPLDDPGTQQARVDLMFQERAFWLFNTGHRLGDLRRLIRNYGRTQDQVFPVGPHHRAGEYGSDVNFPLHFQETQNPHFSVEMCNTRQA